MSTCECAHNVILLCTTLLTNSLSLSLSLSLPLPPSLSHTQGEHLRLFPLSATASPNISSDEHNLSDGGEVCNEHLYSLGRFLPTTTNKQGAGGGGNSDLGSTTTSMATLYNSQSIPNHSSPENGRHRVPSSGSNVAMPKKRRVTHSTATSNLLMESYERGSLASAEDTPPPSGHSSPMPLAPLTGATGCGGSSGRHKSLSPQRSNTFSAPKSSLHQQVVSYYLFLVKEEGFSMATSENF